MTTSFWYFNSIQDGGDKKATLLEMFHTYLEMMKLGTVITCLKKNQKIY